VSDEGVAEEKRFSQEAFAHHAGLHRVAVGWIEQGKRVSSLRTLVKISHGFGISLSDLLRGVDSCHKKRKHQPH
jgi:transcriptional regulator with XRE-family HTH domain